MKKQAISESRRLMIKSGIALAAGTLVSGTHVEAATQARSLRIGYQKGMLSIVRGRGTLEQRLTSLGAKVEWIEFPSGPPQLEALNVGAIDFGDVGEAPPIFAQAAGTPIVYYGETARRPQSEALVVPADSPIHSVAQLKGKRVAVTKGSNAHFLLVRLLQAANLSYADVSPVWLSPADARAAFEQKSVDAWAIWDPFLAVVQSTSKARIVADGTGVVENRAFFFTSQRYIEKNGDILRVALEEVSRVDAWVKGNRDAASSEFSRLWGVPPDIVAISLARLQYGVETVTDEALANQQRIADTFVELKLLPKRIDVTEAAPHAHA